MAKRAVLQFLLVLLLLTGQQGALVHSVWHLNDHLAAHDHHDHAGAAHDHQDDENSSQSRLCDLHAALGTLLGGDCGGQSTVAVPDIPNGLATQAAVWRAAQPALTPPSRAPPVLL
jgi:hypothetical protein